ncbi:YifB family Mg chelatase-like AAA ATPase [Candidatus Nomurabacteria bacterium]|nr:YifB family Mg chelatase-like AAA ATPase [Candidatus Nomurabacteria bacterium]USN94686.1 MAG: YifB family Mg chelatase-like AAA ATPase [Candidatus Nomurabacteria bacterium]
MAFSRVYSAQPDLLDAGIITVETDITPNTLHAFSIVGLAEKSVDEAKDRVSSALKNSGFHSPKQSNQKIVVSLSPADIKKDGSSFDIAIAISYLLSSSQIKASTDNMIFLGELSLNGEIKPIRGTLPLVIAAKNSGFTEVFVPKQNVKEAGLVRGITIYGVEKLKDLVEHIKESEEKIFSLTPEKETEIVYQESAQSIFDISDIRGQESAKRGLEIAAAGGHNIALYGPPGTGKTMLAKVFRSLLPPLSNEEVIEVTGIHSVSGVLDEDFVTMPPFRSPHHTASYVSLIGGGAKPKPGEVTLAHRGVLFMDELPEFDKKVLEAMRQPLEDNIVSITRASGRAIFPSNFMLIAAMNPCPCGNLTSTKKRCICRQSDIERYKRKISGPIMDRVDMWILVGDIDLAKLGDKDENAEKTSSVKERVSLARKAQKNRFEKDGKKVFLNSDMNVKDLEVYAKLDENLKNILVKSAEKLGLSARAFHRVQKIARTIADLEGEEDIKEAHLLEALQYRPKF